MRDFIDCGMTMYTPAGPVDLVPLNRRLEGLRADVVEDERPAAILALTHLGHPVERIAKVLNMHPARVREVLASRGMAEVPADSESIAWTGVAYTSAAKRRAKRRAGLVEVDGRPFHPEAPHGSNYAYTDFGCHCKPCQLAHAAALAETRRRKAMAA
jgi:hypothetical protein